MRRKMILVFSTLLLASAPLFANISVAHGEKSASTVTDQSGVVHAESEELTEDQIEQFILIQPFVSVQGEFVVFDSEKAKEHGVPDELIAEVEKDFDKLNKEMDDDVKFAPSSSLNNSKYFKSVKWITRKGVVSLSINPKPILYSNPNPNALSYYASKSFSKLKKAYSGSKKWKNTGSMRAQYDCHILIARGVKTPWNLEPHRTETNLTKVIAKGCNP